MVRHVLGLGLAVTACTDVERGATQQEVIGGRLTPAGTYPGVGALMLHPLPDVVAELCTGTLIAPDAVLAAAHCFDRSIVGTALPEFTLATDARGGAGLVAGQAAIVHEAFAIDAPLGPGLAEFHDVGILRLAAPITDVAPVPMIRPADVAALTPGHDLTIVGYGVDDRGGLGVEYDATTDLVALNATEMEVARPGQPQNCRGDSGGPALADLGDGPRLVGITSRSFDGGALCTSGGIDTRVDAYLAWIHAAVPTGIPCDSGEAPACADGGCATGAGGTAPGALLLLAAGALILRRHGGRP